MNALPLFKVRTDYVHVLQGDTYVSIDRSRVDSIQYHEGVLTVQYHGRGEVSLQCAGAEADEVLRLLRVLQDQRDRNQALRQREKADAASLLPGIFG